MALHPLFKRLIRRAYHAGHGNLHTKTDAQIRAHFRQFNLQAPQVEVNVESYHPKVGVHFEIIRAPGPAKGTVFYFRGSAFTGGPLDETHGYCQWLARLLEKDIVIVLFRVAPKHRFPTYFEDAKDALHWLCERAQAYRLTAPFVLWGESSGGTMAASVCQYFENLGHSLFDQLVLIYPMMDLAHDYPSKKQYGYGYLLDLPMIEWLKKRTLNSKKECWDYRMSPALGEIKSMPPTILLTAEFDPLRDEAESYAKRLASLTHVVHRRVPGMIHSFIRYYEKLPPAQESLSWIKSQLEHCHVP